MSEAAAISTGAANGSQTLNRIPLATYRLQLGADLTLDQVTALLPYLQRLGISDVYLSPLFRARAESSHGYDVVDHGMIDPAIGDMQSFARLATAAREAGMGVLLDVVPNHMGINDPANVWWLDVLENGQGSQFADFFDIEWHPPSATLQNKILLPFLGEPFGQVLEKGGFTIVYRERRFQLEYGPRRFPLAPPSWVAVLGVASRDGTLLGSENPSVRADRDELESVVTQLRNLPPGLQRDSASMAVRYREQAIAAQRLEKLAAGSPEVRDAIDRALQQINGEPGNAKSFDQLETLLDEQWYRLAYWRVASDEINYRRFFDVNDLAAIRVDNTRVFEQVHRLVATLLKAGWVTGLRIDHPDGLRDPLAYFKSLQTLYRNHRASEESAATDVYVLAEKILSGDEPLPVEWQVSGTTGYDLMNVTGRVQVCGAGVDALRSAYARIIGRSQKPAEAVYESRRTVLLTTMASELQMLSVQLYRLAQKHRASRDFTQPALQRALREVLASMTVYRTYVRGDSWEVAEADYRTITLAVRMAKRRNRTMPHSVFDFIASILLLEHPPTVSAEQAEDRRQFALKFQQVSGPIAAKGVEDTAFYRYYPLASLNEVGGEVDAKPLTLDEFHRVMRHRASTWPHSMNATSTHDSKRGEDFRARLHVLSEMPREWEQAFERWHEMNKNFLGEFEGEAVPDANEEYFIYQTLVGTWPLGDQSDAERQEYCERLLHYFEKAFREAKIHSSWMNPGENYEASVRAFVTKTLSAENSAFTDEVDAFVGGIADAGFVNGLAQVLLKIALPGVPDFYRGTELWDFNLVDPDNRRPVDYDGRLHRLKKLWPKAEQDVAELAQGLAARWPDPDVKLWVTMRALQARRELPEAFSVGEYISLTVTGDAAEHILAFARRADEQIAVCVVPRHLRRLREKQKSSVASKNWLADWADTSVVLPTDYPRDWKCRIVGNRYRLDEPGDGLMETSDSGLRVADLFATLPVALLGPALRENAESALR